MLASENRLGRGGKDAPQDDGIEGISTIASGPLKRCCNLIGSSSDQCTMCISVPDMEDWRVTRYPAKVEKKAVRVEGQPV